MDGNIFIIAGENEPIKVKLYDFENYSHLSFAKNLILLLFTSPQCNDVAKNFKMYIEAHNIEFINILQEVNCPLYDYTPEK